jgi:hypothetical protein
MTTNDILEATEQLAEEQRELLLNLLHRRQVETRREQIAQHSVTARTACRAGQLTTETATDLLERLHASLAKEE